MTTAARRRLTSATVLFVLAFAWATRGYCPMADGACGHERQAASTAHCHPADDDAQGVRAQRPPCCHSRLSGDTAAVTKAVPDVSAPLETARVPVVATSGAELFGRVSATRSDGHSPPPTVLRI